MLMINIFALIITYVNLVSTESTYCGNWAEFGDEKCIQIIDKEKVVNYENAVEICAQTEKSHLITINSENEQIFLEKYLFKDKQIVENVWIGLKNENGLKWSDKSSVDYTNWVDKSQLNNTELNCTQILGEVFARGKWVNEYCNKKAVVICQIIIEGKKFIQENKNLRKEIENLKSKLNLLINPDFSENKLVSRIKQYHSHYNISKPYIDFDNRLKVLFTVWNNSYVTILRNNSLFTLCESLNSTMIEIRSNEKQIIVDKLQFEWGIGPKYHFWLNGIRDSSGKWRWNTDGMEFNYTNWRKNEPNSGIEHNLVDINYSDSSKSSDWVSANLQHSNGIICEYELK